MSDSLRDRLAAVVAGSLIGQAERLGDYASYSADPKTGRDGRVFLDATAIDPLMVADAILALPGYAVVKLPEPDRGGGYGDDGVGWGTDNNSVFASGGMVYDQYSELSPAQARDIGSWWLAAAEYAEREQ